MAGDWGSSSGGVRIGAFYTSIEYRNGGAEARITGAKIRIDSPNITDSSNSWSWSHVKHPFVAVGRSLNMRVSENNVRTSAGVEALAAYLRAASIVVGTGQPAVMWCNLNDEGDLLESLVPGAIQVSGSDTDDAKEEKLLAFSSGEARVLVIKPVIGAWGLNWQHCAHMTTFASHSFEQYYQSVRRSWRFGQTREVVVDLIVSDGEGRVLDNLRRKSAQAEAMFASLVRYMREGMSLDRMRTFSKSMEVPSWL
jgi:hypothetical protein